MKTEATKVADAWIRRDDPALKALVEAANRICRKYGVNEDGVEKDWTEWTDLREALALWIGNDSVQAAEPRRTKEGE